MKEFVRNSAGKLILVTTDPEQQLFELISKSINQIEERVGIPITNFTTLLELRRKM
jgi:hypothetical protein